MPTELRITMLILPYPTAQLRPASCEWGQGIPTPGTSEVHAVHVLQVTEAADPVA